MLQEKIKRLRTIIDNSDYTVALCGSGMMEESGFSSVKYQEKAYEIEQKYNASPEEIYTSSFFSTRPEKFYRFYKEEMIRNHPETTVSGKVLAEMERAGKLQCIITANTYNLPQRSGCQNVINLHGSIYHNRCIKCRKEYPLEYIMQAKGVPLCEVCKNIIRPKVSLFGEMLDNTLLTRTMEEIARADVLLLLGTSLGSDTFSSYVSDFEGSYLVIIHHNEHHLDYKADLLILDRPKYILPKLGY